MHCALCIDLDAQVKCDNGALPKCELQHKHRSEFFAQMLDAVSMLGTLGVRVLRFAVLNAHRVQN